MRTPPATLPAAFATPLPRTIFTRAAAPRRATSPRRCPSVTSPRPPPTMTSFRKYHGIGNDFVLIDNRSRATPLLTPAQSASLCNRNTGVGADGVIFLLPPTHHTSDFAMRLHNSDGTEPEMCGNGIRCLARFAHDLHLPSREGRFVVDTGAGVIVPEIVQGGDVRVDMGKPVLEPVEVPTKLKCGEGEGYVGVLEGVGGRDWEMTCVSMGNPHAVTFVSKEVYNEMDARLEVLGPLFETHDAFPAKTNTEFVCEREGGELDMLVWERGAGRTMACGTGACAVLVAAVLRGKAQKDVPVIVHLPGGDLVIEWISDSGRVMMTGPAELVFEGKLAQE